MELFFNRNPQLTKWLVGSGALHEPFVVVDVGVQGGENPRWHFLGDHLVFHGFDAISEVIDIASINKAYERVLKGDVRYRFVIDMASLA